MSATLMSGFLAMAFQFDENSIKWLWEEQIPVAIILIIATIIFGIFWIFEQKRIKSCTNPDNYL